MLTDPQQGTTMVDRLAAEMDLGFGAVPLDVLVLRMIAAIVLGGIIGFEREERGKDAGLRTHMLIAFASCLFLLISQALADLPFSGASNVNVDPLRLVEAVTAGVAFLSAGLIFSRNGSVQNVTTGASMWLAGAIGTACGVGQIGLAGLATLMVVIVLAVIGRLQSKLGPRARDSAPDEGMSEGSDKLRHAQAHGHRDKGAI
ncbi:MgtC/SapB family protein [Roseibium aggregatum]|nr:MgtC/SapB family protein [Roseibium aggregatum]UES42770.1 MgtC/SapB family protein [Roseibium aggregatum]